MSRTEEPIGEVNKVVLTFYWEADKLAFLMGCAERSGCTVADIVNSILEDWADSANLAFSLIPSDVTVHVGSFVREAEVKS